MRNAITAGDYPQVAVCSQLHCGRRRQSNCRLNLWVITSITALAFGASVRATALTCIPLPKVE